MSTNRAFFNRPYAVVRTADGRNFELLEPIVFTSGGGHVITVPPGAVSDGASIPRLFWHVLPPFGPYWLAAFVHDYLYRQTDYPRDFCDAMFSEMMATLGVPDITAHVIFDAVRLGGESAFAADRAAQAKAQTATASQPLATVQNDPPGTPPVGDPPPDPPDPGTTSQN